MHYFVFADPDVQGAPTRHAVDYAGIGLTAPRASRADHAVRHPVDRRFAGRLGQWKWLLEAQRVQRGAPWVLGLGIGGIALLAVVGPRPWLVLGYVNVVCVALGVLIGQIRTTRRWLILPALGVIATDVLMVCVDPSFGIVH